MSTVDIRHFDDDMLQDIAAKIFMGQTTTSAATSDRGRAVQSLASPHQREARGSGLESDMGLTLLDETSPTFDMEAFFDASEDFDFDLDDEPETLPGADSLELQHLLGDTLDCQPNLSPSMVPTAPGSSTMSALDPAPSVSSLLNIVNGTDPLPYSTSQSSAYQQSASPLTDSATGSSNPLMPAAANAPSAASTGMYAAGHQPTHAAAAPSTSMNAARSQYVQPSAAAAGGFSSMGVNAAQSQYVQPSAAAGGFSSMGMNVAGAQYVQPSAAAAGGFSSTSMNAARSQYVQPSAAAGGFSSMGMNVAGAQYVQPSAAAGGFSSMGMNVAGAQYVQPSAAAAGGFSSTSMNAARSQYVQPSAAAAGGFSSMGVNAAQSQCVQPSAAAGGFSSMGVNVAGAHSPATFAAAAGFLSTGMYADRPQDPPLSAATSAAGSSFMGMNVAGAHYPPSTILAASQPTGVPDALFMPLQRTLTTSQPLHHSLASIGTNCPLPTGPDTAAFPPALARTAGCESPAWLGHPPGATVGPQAIGLALPGAPSNASGPQRQKTCKRKQAPEAQLQQQAKKKTQKQQSEKQAKKKTRKQQSEEQEQQEREGPPRARPMAQYTCLLNLKAVLDELEAAFDQDAAAAVAEVPAAGGAGEGDVRGSAAGVQAKPVGWGVVSTSIL
ncbi:hypothetical protein PLESTM_000864500 [Pleodorina starrii]|nr:hypothetical protein PLESTM_000864500 [Pleodorina starrii]